MPTLLRVGAYRFFCYAGDQDEPPHIHIERDEDQAKFWLSPIRLQKNKGFSRTEINHIQKLTQEHQEQLLAGWNDFFND
jgi:hypothetical protein